MSKRRSKSNEVTLWQIAKAWLAAKLTSIDGIPLPPEGRSSQENQAGVGTLSSFALGSVLPPFDLRLLKVLKDLWISNPDFSQHISNAESLGNTGHTLTVDAANDSQAEAALTRINEAASRIYPNGAGVDGLINAYLDQLAWSGGLSSEDVIDFAGQRVNKVVIVPIEQIRFRYIDGRYVPHQQPGTLLGVGRGPLGLIPLNELTYHYYALQTIENSPYAKPTASAAVDILIGPQQDAIDNIKFIVEKMGLLGLVSVLLTPPPRKPNETEDEYQRRAKTVLQAAKSVLQSGFKNGLLVAFRDYKIDHSNVASDARGSKEIFQVIEELAFSGMGSMAAFHGRNYTTTETFADVIYSILAAQVVNRQRLVKRRQEQTYRLDLLMGGVTVDGISLNFNRVEARNEYQKAQAEQIRQQMVLERARTGIISPDQAAQELGYDSAFDPELLASAPEVAQALRAKLWAKRAGVTATCRFDRSAQRYRLVSSKIEIASEPVEADDTGKVREFKKKAA